MKHFFHLPGLVLALFLFPVWAASADHSLLTVSGDIEKTNRAPFTEDHHGMFAHHEITFDKGFQFNRDMLAALPQTEVDERNPTSVGIYSGPLLTDILDHVGASSDRIVLTGLDGYVAEFNRDELDRYKPIIAIDRDGQPLAIGEFGPVKLSFPRTGDPETDKELRIQAVWALFHISVEQE